MTLHCRLNNLSAIIFPRFTAHGTLCCCNENKMCAVLVCIGMYVHKYIMSLFNRSLSIKIIVIKNEK